MISERSDKTCRVFCAVELPEHLRDRIVKHISELRRVVPDARSGWSRPENIHVTLKFFGEIPLAAVEQIRIAAARAVEGVASFNIQAGETGMFPSRSSPRVLWIGVHDPTGNLAQLHARLEDESAALGFEKETRAFKPHLTLARLRGADHRRNQRREDAQVSRRLADAHAAMQFKRAEITVAELLVIRSEPGPAGAKYTVLSRHALAGPNN